MALLLSSLRQLVLACLLSAWAIEAAGNGDAGATASPDAGAAGPGLAAASQVSKVTGPPAFFLQDPTTGMCLGGATFRRCSIQTLWYVQGKPGAYSIHHRPVDEGEDDECFGKAQCHLDESPAQLANCGHCGAKKWNIVGDNDLGYFLTEDNNKNCVKRVGDKAMVMKCDKGSSSMSLQCEFFFALLQQWHLHLPPI